MPEPADALSRFPRERTWLLPALHALQHRDRWLSPATLEEAADHLRVPKSEVYGVATHYPEFRLTEPGRRVVRVCVGLSCRVRGGLDVLAACERRLGIAAGATTPDGGVTLERLDCAFDCAMAPVVEVEGAHRGRVEAGTVDALLAAPPPHPALSLSGGEGSRGSPLPSGDGPRDLPLPSGEKAGVRGAPRLTLPPITLVVGTGTCGLSVGAADTLEALHDEIARRHFPARVVAGGCNGMCWAAPVVTVLRGDEAPRVIPRVTPNRAAALLDAVGSGAPLEHADVAAFLAGQRRELMSRCGITDPGDIADAMRRGSYQALERVLAEAQPGRVIETVKRAGLRGRGGAYFQAALKWEGARRAPGSIKYLIVNGEEGEPGIFKDRHLLEGDPHRLLEGALLAAYAAGASRVILYIHGEAHLAARHVARALEQARAGGFVGERVLGSDFSVAVEIRRGAGGFVLGEETALMESLEGRRAMPRPKPPFPTESGVHGRPTVINNVETLFTVPLILGRGADWWTGLGRGHGTKVFGLSGHVARPGVIEAELGLTLRDLLERMGGGAPDARAVTAVALGGPSGILVPPRRFDEPLVPGGNPNPGTGGIAALHAGVPVAEAVRVLLDFNTRESCGKCTPCREGTARLRDMLDGSAPVDRQAVTELADVVRVASLCGLGQAAPLSILSALGDFPGEL
ncbi:MAG TPA: NAD(P)H-dependent oxidoreductase subunit E [Candidatus Limnocylindria bacterium]|nr:NAD(P)H-dependent oxidoreductase subunit E [Candidatus Limnocylindria bacterium]